MESTSLCSSSLSFNPFSSSRTCLRNHRQRKAISMKTFAMRREAHDQNCSGRLVDENMIVLRKRLHELKMIERNYEPPANWMEWEKRCYTSYDSIICDVMGVLQSQLMNTRPSLALGMLALIVLSVPTSAAVMFFHVMEITKGVLVAGIHMM
ncbi:uncharacterized protein LOC110423366 [Herrania umbratica]|uniref:Uncharacterized protein LOC110423366 n=1 Tax=Herrania umbratica TaxID=108875 RepID=A0A6J1B1Q6_9ROSI|nr:uncharacterized protein LOC110423366 [Herrania umbratica]